MPIVPDPTSKTKLVGSIEEINAAFLKANYLLGLAFVDENQQEWPDSIYDHHINNAIAEFEKLTKVHVVRKVITDERHDYHASDYAMFTSEPSLAR